MSEAVEAVEAAAGEATEVADAAAADVATEEATQAASEAVNAADLSALTLDGFNLDTVSGLIDEAPLSELQKTTLKTAIDQAQFNPALLDAALDQVRGALGL